MRNSRRRTNFLSLNANSLLNIINAFPIYEARPIKQPTMLLKTSIKLIKLSVQDSIEASITAVMFYNRKNQVSRKANFN